MTEPLTLRVAAVPGRTVFAVDEHSRTIPTRIVGREPDGTPKPEGELIPARKTPDGRVIADQEFYRAALLSGDLVEMQLAPMPKSEPTHEGS